MPTKNNLSQKEYQGIRYLELYLERKKDKDSVLIYLHGEGGEELIYGCEAFLFLSLGDI